MGLSKGESRRTETMPSFIKMFTAQQSSKLNNTHQGNQRPPKSSDRTDFSKDPLARARNELPGRRTPEAARSLERAPFHAQSQTDLVGYIEDTGGRETDNMPKQSSHLQSSHFQPSSLHKDVNVRKDVAMPQKEKDPGLDDGLDILRQTPENTIGRTLVVSGEVRFDNLLRIDGVFEGELIGVGSNLIIGPTAKVTSNLTGLEEVYVLGILVGNVQCEKMQIRNTGCVTGDIECTSLGMDPTVILRGRTNVIPPGRNKSGSLDIGSKSKSTRQDKKVAKERQVSEEKSSSSAQDDSSYSSSAHSTVESLSPSSPSKASGSSRPSNESNPADGPAVPMTPLMSQHSRSSTRTSDITNGSRSAGGEGESDVDSNRSGDGGLRWAEVSGGNTHHVAPLSKPKSTRSNAGVRSIAKSTPLGGGGVGGNGRAYVTQRKASQSSMNYAPGHEDLGTKTPADFPTKMGRKQWPPVAT